MDNFARMHKMQPIDYRNACEAFDLPPGECLMCAAHERDLAAAAKVGLRTAFIHRPNEFRKLPHSACDCDPRLHPQAPSSLKTSRAPRKLSIAAGTPQ